ncbi:hypothetical protein FH144_07790 [Staphylococcus caledonicus]|uniref:hypothetical protein n=1 Tax=Staphylococcus sp. acrmy TaxID=2929076 RepID=UPI001F58CCC9|nr:hypothetical protein [Staphylococcus sp. acrmy]MCI2948326.1 hypothetical protein [Staphylococcus sp. acrmy]
MHWNLYLLKIDGEFEIVLAGCDLVPNRAYDKVLPTTEKIARQSDKVYFDGERLKLKDGEALLPLEELNTQDDNSRELVSQKDEPVVFDID